VNYFLEIFGGDAMPLAGLNSDKHFVFQSSGDCPLVFFTIPLGEIMTLLAGNSGRLYWDGPHCPVSYEGVVTLWQRLQGQLHV
jgi:hypothetical protein